MDIGIALLLLFVLTGADGSHIVGGRESAPHSRPYMASLQAEGRLICGAALVREDFVLTAAHCAIPVPFTVVLGVNTLSGSESTRQEFRIVRSIPHPDYDGRANDIMLLKLNGSAQLDETVQLITLKRDRVQTSSRCITTGWGDIGNNTLPARLQEVNVTVLQQSSCRSKWEPIAITETMVCGTGDGNFQGACSGDSGGPLVCDGEASGVVCFSSQRCGDRRFPDVYTRVSSFLDWITDVMNSN